MASTVLDSSPALSIQGLKHKPWTQHLFYRSAHILTKRCLHNTLPAVFFEIANVWKTDLMSSNRGSLLPSVLSHFSPVQLFVTPWTVALPGPLSMGFSRQEHWSGLPCPPPGHLLSPGMEPASPVSPALQADYLLCTGNELQLLRTWGKATV